MKEINDRRDFLKKMAIDAGGISLASMPQTGFSKNNFTSDGKDVARNNYIDSIANILTCSKGLIG